MRTHYDTLGVSRKSTPQEIKSAYRKIVLEHHPDRSKDPQSKPVFLSATEAYGVLSDTRKRNVYNVTLDLMAPPKPTAQAATAAAKAATQKPEPVKPAAPQPEAPKVQTVPQQLAQLQVMFNRGQVADAEKKAWDILSQSGREAIPYGILADIARARGQVHEAAQYYAYAAQFDPRNPTYQERYEQLLGSSRLKEGRNKNIRLESKERNLVTLCFGAILVLCCVVYVTISAERPMFVNVPFLSTWTIGLVSMLFFAGIAVGSALSIGHFLDTFETTTIGRAGQIWLITALAMISFWLGGLVYVGFGLAQKAFSVSLTRMLAGVAATLILMTIGALFSRTLAVSQVFLFGGNVVFLGTITGWIGADLLRRA